MKTQLLALVVVAFVFLDSGYTLICHSCTEPPCVRHEQCSEGQNLCFEKSYQGDMFGLRTVKGCTDTCADPGENEKVTYCKSDKCN
ncbi:toxin 3FTx-Dis4-like [Ahaetulla prasina]|uniref:toxin 3FTx-Dis4-like n=1 Tax=Ahaetulla prasina TaxID=499056 RepID=UPI0026472F90|nr:toxin 3FTx-Dis4-like [Ahaetulla prasina]